MSKVFRFQKQPSEQMYKSVDFVNRIASGAAISTQGVTAVDPVGTDVTGVVIGLTAISGTTIQFQVKAGTTGVLYKITVVATLDNADVLEEEVYMDVLEQ